MKPTKLSELIEVLEFDSDEYTTDGEIIPKRGWKGNLLLARIRWAKPNRLAPTAPSPSNSTPTPATNPPQTRQTLASPRLRRPLAI